MHVDALMAATAVDQVPAAHFVQADAAEAAYVPGIHTAQTEAAVVGEYKPARHSVHAAKLGPEA